MDAIIEAMFYAAQAAYSYKGGPIYVFDQASAGEKRALKETAKILAGMPDAPVTDAAQAIVEAISPAVHRGINRPWEDMDGRSRYNLHLVVEAYRRAAGQVL